MDFESDSVAVNIHGTKFLSKSISNRILWDGMKLLASKETNTCVADWYFIYQDEEGDSIQGSSQEEWHCALAVGYKKTIFSIDLYPMTTIEDNLNMHKMTINSDKCFVYKSQQLVEGNTRTENTKSMTPCCFKGNNCGVQNSNSCYSQSIENLDHNIDNGLDQPKIVNPTLNQYKYTEEALRAVTLPLGPIGGGNIAIAGDGGIRQWQINNKVSHNAQAPDSFFAIKVGSTAAILQSATWYDQKGFKPAPIVTDHLVPKESASLLSKCPGVKTIEITAKYPVVEVDYIDPLLETVKVHLEAWSPKIPLNSEASGVPVVIFDYHITNTSAVDQEISLLASLQNLVGWNAHDPIINEVQSNGYGGNNNCLYTQGNLFGIVMSNPNMQSNDAFNGYLSIAALQETGDKMTTMLQYSSVETLWNVFSKETYLHGQGEPGVSKPGFTFNGAVNTTRVVKAHSSTVFTYILSWYFPNRYKDWTIGVNIPNTNIWVGNHYAKQWKNIEDVLAYIQGNIDSFRISTYKFRESMFESTLPWQLVDSAAGRVSVLNSPTCMWQADGNFYAFEGCSTNRGCCPLNCTHVWNFEMALASLYPDLERTMREIDLLHQITPHGVIPSRTPCPLELKRLWSTWPDYSCDPASTLICVDGEIGTILKTYREYKHGADLGWLKSLWKPLKAVMNHWLDVLDTEKNGLVFGPQPNTYDVATYGYMVAIGTLYLCGLRAMEEMSKIVNDLDFAKVCHNRFVLGTVNLDEECFTNGKWYTHVVDPHHMTNVLTDATLVGALYGQWWAHILGLGYLLPKEHIVSHLKYTYQRNYVESFDPSTQKPRAFCDQRDSNWVTGKWNDGEVPKSPLLYSFEVAWSGVIYPFAALLMIEQLTDESLDVLEKTRQMYDGTRRSPWNEIECGDHYARPMSAFSLFALASGQTWSYSENGSIVLKFNPVLNKGNFSGFFILGSCWGTYSQQKYAEKSWQVKLKVEYGTLLLSSFSYHIDSSPISVSVRGETPLFSFLKKCSSSIIDFLQTLKVDMGDCLVVDSVEVA